MQAVFCTPVMDFHKGQLTSPHMKTGDGFQCSGIRNNFKMSSDLGNENYEPNKSRIKLIKRLQKLTSDHNKIKNQCF